MRLSVSVCQPILHVDNVTLHLHSSHLVVDLVVQILAVEGRAQGDLIPTIVHVKVVFNDGLQLVLNKRFEIVELLDCSIGVF